MRAGNNNAAFFFTVGLVVGSLWLSIFFFFFVGKSTVLQYSETIVTNCSAINEQNQKIQHTQLEITNPFRNMAGMTKLFHEKFYKHDPAVCVIIRTYQGHRSLLPALISSLASNEYPNMHIYLVDTQGDFEDLPKFEPLFNTLYSREFVHMGNVTKQYARQRYPEFTTPDFGYLQTDLMIEQLSAPDHPHQCAYFMATNGDNLYSSDLMTHTVTYLREQWNLIGFHFLTHYCYEKSESWRPRPGCYSSHYTEFRLQRIDLGAAMFRKARMLERNNSFVMNELNKDPKGTFVEVHFLDGYFYERFARDEPLQIVLNATLFLHQ